MSMKVLRCLGIRKRHMARKSPCFLRSLSPRSGPNVPHFFHSASLSVPPRQSPESRLRYALLFVRTENWGGFKNQQRGALSR